MSELHLVTGLLLFGIVLLVGTVMLIAVAKTKESVNIEINIKVL